MHLSPGDTDDGDAEQQAVEEVGETDPNASNEEPQHIHEHAQTARLRLLPLYFRAEGPNSQYAQLHTLQAERDTDDGNHQDQSCDEILNGSMQPTKDQPNDVTKYLHVQITTAVPLVATMSIEPLAPTVS